MEKFCTKLWYVSLMLLNLGSQVLNLRTKVWHGDFYEDKILFLLAWMNNCLSIDENT